MLTHNPLAFKLAVHEGQIYKCLPVHSKYSEFGGYSFLSFFLTSYTNLHSQNDSSKLQSVFKIPLFGATTKESFKIDIKILQQILIIIHQDLTKYL